jgi:hypothetical protein
VTRTYLPVKADLGLFFELFRSVITIGNLSELRVATVTKRCTYPTRWP